MLSVYSAAIAPLPPFFEKLARDAGRLRKLVVEFDPSSAQADDSYYQAFRWLGERSPDTGYLAACPRIWFTRVGDEVWMRWDNTGLSIDEFPAWAATSGVLRMSVRQYNSECRDFTKRLLAAMEQRIERIGRGEATPQVAAAIESLREQHATWRAELDGYSREYQPDIPWDEAEEAVRRVAERAGVTL